MHKNTVRTDRGKAGHRARRRHRAQSRGHAGHRARRRRSGASRRPEADSSFSSLPGRDLARMETLVGRLAVQGVRVEAPNDHQI